MEGVDTEIGPSGTPKITTPIAVVGNGFRGGDVASVLPANGFTDLDACGGAVLNYFGELNARGAIYSDAPSAGRSFTR